MLHHTATLFFVVKAISSAALQLPLCFWCLMLFTLSDWVDMCYFQQCSLSARSMRSFYRAVMPFDLRIDMLLTSHRDVAPGVVTAYQRQIWYQIPKIPKVNGKCTLVHFCSFNIEGSPRWRISIITYLAPWDLCWGESSMHPFHAICQIQNWSNLDQECVGGKFARFWKLCVNIHAFSGGKRL